LLAYKLAGQMLGVLVLAVFMTAACAPHAAWVGAGFVGLLLAMVFLQLFSMAVALVASMVGALAYNRGRRLALAALAALALAGALRAGREALGWEPWDVLARVEQSGAVQAALTPLRWFVEAFTSERLWPDLLKWVGAGPGPRRRAAGAASSPWTRSTWRRPRRPARGSTPGSSGCGAEGVGPTLRRAGRTRVGLPMGPWWGGAGPIAWRQLTTGPARLRPGAGRAAGPGSMLVPACSAPGTIPGRPGVGR
jgi:hypothetical protein